MFDLRYDGCNFAELTDCGDRERPEGYPPTVTPPEGTTTTTVTPSVNATEDPITTTESGNLTTTDLPPGNFTCPTPGGAFPHERFCEYYYECEAYVPTLMKCQADYLFDLRYNGCNFPDLTDCGDRERPEGYPTTITPPESTTREEPITTDDSGNWTTTALPTTDSGNVTTTPTTPTNSTTTTEKPNPGKSVLDHPILFIAIILYGY